MLVTQAGSPYYAEQAYECIEKTIASAGFKTLKLHNQVMTLGEWGWVLGAKNSRGNLKQQLRTSKLTTETDWLTNDALTMISSFGKKVFEKDYSEVRNQPPSRSSTLQVLFGWSVGFVLSRD